MKKTMDMRKTYEAPKCETVNVQTLGGLLVASGDPNFSMGWGGEGTNGEYGD